MSCTVTVDGPCRRTLTFQVERERLRADFEAGLQELSRSVQIKGFRPGKVPAAVVRKTHGPRLREEIRRRVMGEEFSAAVKEHSLRPVGDPQMNLEKLSDEGDAPFTFEVAIEVVPDFTLNVPDTLPVTVTLADVTDAMLDGEIQRLREQRATLEEAAEGAVVAGDDILEGTVVYVVDGAELEPRDKRPAFLRHSVIDSIPVEGSAAALVGRRVGDRVELQTTLPPHFAPQVHAGKPATLRYTIERHRIMKVPPFDAESLARYGVADEAELRERVRQELEAQRARARDQQTDVLVQRQLVELHPFELPERLLAKAIDHKVHEIAHRLMKERGLDADAGHHQAEAQREEIARSTTFGLRVAFLLTRIAEEHDLDPGREAAEQQVRVMAAQQGQDSEQALEASRREGWLADVHEQLIHQKARDWLRQRAEVTITQPPAAPAQGTLGSSASG